MDTLKISYHPEQGSPGIDDDPKNPISRALTSLMRDSSRLPTFTQAFLIDDTEGEPYRWFGVFVRSAGDRILFFPGFKENPSGLRGSAGELKIERQFNFDHISLEKDRKSWHVTTPRSKDHQGGPPAKDLGEGRVFWFGLSLASLDVMRELKSETVATFQVSEKSATWKKDEFFRARDGKEFPGVFMPRKPNPPGRAVFPVVSVIVGAPDFKTYTGPEMGWAYGSQFVSGEPAADVPIPRLIQRFHLDETTDIQLTAAWAPGGLSIPSILASPRD